MPEEPDSILAMFNEMVRAGYITPVEQMDVMRLPGEFLNAPSYTTYGTSSVPIQTGERTNAELERHS